MILAVVIVSATCPVTAAALYKWIDEDGTVRYSDRMPPEQVKRQHQELNAQGVVVTTREAAKSQAEIAAEAEERRKLEASEAEEARLMKIQQQQDQVLLMTFSSEEELELARQNRLEVLESVIQLIQNNIETTQHTLAELQDNAERNFLSQGKEVPGGLAQKIEHFTRKIETRTEQLATKLAEKARINEKYQTDLTRFRELKAGTN